MKTNTILLRLLRSVAVLLSFSLTLSVLNASAFQHGHESPVQFSDNLNAVFNVIMRPIASECDPAALGASSTQSFTDDFTLTSRSPAHGVRFYRVRVASPP